MKTTTFGEVIRRRRRQLDLTQAQVAHQIETSVPYIGLLESSRRHPSVEIVRKLGQVLELEARELFFLANPDAKELLLSRESNQRPACSEPYEGSSVEMAAHDLEIRRHWAEAIELVDPISALLEPLIMRLATARFHESRSRRVTGERALQSPG